MNLVEILTEQTRMRPKAAAIIEMRRGRDRVTTFTELEEQSAKVARLLRNSGIQADDPVLIFHAMSSELYVVLLGVFRIGATAMFLDPSAGRAHIERCCELQAPRALIASPKAHLLRLTSAALRRVPRKFVVGAWVPGATPLTNAEKEPPLETCERCDGDAPALLTFTSGSTGLPKAAVRSHGFLLAQHHVLERHIKLVAGEVDLTTLPVFLLANLASGVTSVIPDADLRAPGAVDPAPIVAQIERHRVTRCAASPAFFERLLSSPNREPLRGLQKIYTGGAPVFARLLDDLCDCAPNAKIEAVYGSTEAEPIAHLSASDFRAEDRLAMRRGHGLLAGGPIEDIQVRIINDQWGKPLGSATAAEFERMQVPAGQSGEIVVAGAHVLKGYLHGRGNEETKFSVDGEVWHRTGDAGKFDGQGRLWLLGRCSARIQDEHGDLYPFAVECVAMEHLGVRRAAFVSHQGKRLLAVEPRHGFDRPAIEALRNNLAWAHVQDVREINLLPVDKRHNAKIDYPALRELLGKSMRGSNA
jgi:acyl-CoA synthetase (AMP-forming)/AMP-acid ligase II